MSSNYSKSELTNIVKEIVIQHGFSAVGIAKSEAVDLNDKEFFSHWIAQGYHAQMNYLNNYFDSRMDTTLLVPNSKSVISVALNYFPESKIPEDKYQIAWYAYGKDYHEIVKDKLAQVYEEINQITSINGRVFCDTAPIIERYWAWKAGLGWIGKNTQLIIPKAGSTFFLGEIIIDLELDYDIPQKNRCGSCTRCLQACPTNALIAPKVLDANRCISYLTIENREEIPQEFHLAIGNRIYGCDECLKACPWTKFATPTKVEQFKMNNDLAQMNRENWETLTVEKYQQVFKKSAAKRAKITGIQRNIKVASKNKID